MKKVLTCCTIALLCCSFSMFAAYHSPLKNGNNNGNGNGDTTWEEGTWNNGNGNGSHRENKRTHAMGAIEGREVNTNQEFQNGPCVCYCPMVKYVPQYYCVTRCVKEPYTVQKKCCRMVEQKYTKTHCRMVPEYYTKEYCRKVPEYYCVDEQRERNRYVKEQKCRYIPCTYTKKVCSPAPACPAPACPAPACPAPACPTCR